MRGNTKTFEQVRKDILIEEKRRKDLIRKFMERRATHGN